MKSKFLLFGLLPLIFFAGCAKEEIKEPKPPLFKNSCLKEMERPFMIEIDAKSVDCYHDKNQTIFYFNYKKEVEKDWQKISKRKIRIKLNKTSLNSQRACIGDQCVNIIYNKNGLFEKAYPETRPDSALE